MTDTREESLTLPELLNLAIDGRLADMNVCLPGVVETYDRTTQTAKVRPALKRKYVDGKIVELPIINKVPIIFPKFAGGGIHFDLKKGDYVTLIFSQRSLDRWKESGGVVSPDDPRKFNLSDAFGIPGGNPRPGVLSPNGGVDSIEFIGANGASYTSIENSGEIKAKTASGLWSIKADGTATFTTGDTVFTVKPDGELSFTNSGLTFTMKASGKVKIMNSTGELITLLNDLVTEIIGARTLTLLGQQPFVGLNQTFPALLTKLATFKE